MNSKYTRLTSNEPFVEPFNFSALDGPSYFSYSVDKGKYRSAFTYSSQYSEENKILTISNEPQSLIFRICSFITVTLCYICLILSLPFSLIFTLKKSRDYERFVIYRLGRLRGTLGPGLVIVFPCIDSCTKLDLRIKAFSVPPQKIITLDGAVIEIGADIYYSVKDPVLSICNVQNLNHSTRIICQTSLQKYIGKNDLNDLETSRHSIIEKLKEDVNQMTKSWGVEVNQIELSSIKIHSKPDPNLNASSNPLSFLGPLLFPTGSSNVPMEQFQQMLTHQKLPAKELTSWDFPANNHPSHTQNNGKITCNVDQFLCQVKQKLNSLVVKDFGLLYKIIISTDSPTHFDEIFFLDLKYGEGDAGFGFPYDDMPDVTLTLTSNVLMDMINEKISPFNAYIEGQMVIIGDLRGAMKLGSFIQMNK